jgi:golgin subfamily B member 1
MAKQIAELGVQTQLGLDASGFVSGVEAVGGKFGDMQTMFQTTGNIVGGATAAVNDHIDAQARMAVMLENVIAVQNKTERSMSGLFQAQRRLVRGQGGGRSADPAVDFAQASATSRAGFEGQRAGAGPERSTGAVRGDLQGQEAALANNRREQEAIVNLIRSRSNALQSVTAQQARQVQLLQEQKVLQGNVLELDTELVAAESRQAAAAAEADNARREQVAAQTEYARQALSEEENIRKQQTAAMIADLQSRANMESEMAAAQLGYARQAYAEEEELRSRGFSALRADIEARGQLQATQAREQAGYARQAADDEQEERTRAMAALRADIEARGQLQATQAREQAGYARQAADDEQEERTRNFARLRADIEARGRLQANQAREQARGYLDASVILQQLGHQDSQRLFVQRQITQNAQRFAIAMAHVRAEAQHTEEEMRRMQAAFDQINTPDNAAGQIGGANRMGAVVQQAAFGVEDFSSQIERGLIPALGGAANNINMIVGMLGGPYAIAISAAVIAAVQLGKAMGFYGQEAEKSTEALENAEEAISDVADAMEALRDNAELTIGIDFDPDLSSVTATLTRTVSDQLGTFNELGEAARQESLKRIEEEIDAFNTIGQRAKRGFMQLGKLIILAVDSDIYQENEDTANKFTKALEAGEKRIKDIEEERKNLGGDLTATQRLQVKLNDQLKVQSKAILQAEERRAQLARETSFKMRLPGGIAAADKDTRTAQQAQDDFEASERRLLEIASERATLMSASQALGQAAVVTGSQSALDDQMAVEAEIVALNQEALRLSKEQEDSADRHTEAMEEQVKAAEELVKLREKEQKILNKALDELAAIDKAADDANESIWTSITTLNRQGTEGGDAAEAARVKVAKWNDTLDEIRKGENGINQARRMGIRLMDAQMGSLDRRLEQANESGEKQNRLSLRIVGAEMDRDRLLDDIEATQRSILNGTMDETEGRERIVAHGERAVENEKKLAGLRNEARSQVEGIVSATESRLDALDKEYAKERKVRREREKLHDVLQAGFNGGIVDQARSTELVDAFEFAVKAEEKMATLREQLSGASTVAGEVGVVERDSTEAQSIIFKAMREGQSRADQQPIVMEIQSLLAETRRHNQIVERQAAEPGLAVRAIN